MYSELDTVFSLSSLLVMALHGTATEDVHDVTVRKETVEKVKYFNPHSNSIASGLCSYKFVTNKIVNRIPGILRVWPVTLRHTNSFPETLTEVHCDTAGRGCSSSRMFRCVQDRARLEVVYVERSVAGLEVRSHRNITVNIGCSCLAPKLRLSHLVREGVTD